MIYNNGTQFSSRTNANFENACPVIIQKNCEYGYWMYGEKSIFYNFQILSWLEKSIFELCVVLGSKIILSALTCAPYIIKEVLVTNLMHPYHALNLWHTTPLFTFIIEFKVSYFGYHYSSPYTRSWVTKHIHSSSSSSLSNSNYFKSAKKCWCWKLYNGFLVGKNGICVSNFQKIVFFQIFKRCCKQITSI